MKAFSEVPGLWRKDIHRDRRRICVRAAYRIAYDDWIMRADLVTSRGRVTATLFRRRPIRKHTLDVCAVRLAARLDRAVKP